MKATNFSGLWKAIAFLATALTVLFSCSSCEPEEPPVVYEMSITLAVESVTEQSATLVAETMAGNQNLQVIFECFINGQWQSFSAESVSGIQKKTVKKELTSLDPNSSYRVRAYLQDSKEKKVSASQEQEFTTTKTETSVNLTQKDVQRNRATFIVKVKGRNGQDQLGLWFEHFDGTAWKSVFSKNISGAEEQEVEYEISDLLPGTNYKVRAYLLTPSEVKLVTSSELEFTTAQSALLGLVSTEVALTTIDLRLELTPYTDTQVIIEYQGKGLSSQSITSEMYSGSTLLPLEFKLSNLEKNTVYTVKVKTSDNSSNNLELSLETYAVSDYDGNLYHLVTIGSQVFLRENLKTTHFLNGDPIPNVKDAQAWYNFNAPAYCYYNNDPALGEKYGALYNFQATSDPRGLIAGFHTPTIEEFEELIDYLGGEYAAGGKVKTTTSDWQSPNVGATNASGFSALPAGARAYSGDSYDQPEFVRLGKSAMFWTGEIEPRLPQMAYDPYCSYEHEAFFCNGLHFHWAGLSVRLLKN